MPLLDHFRPPLSPRRRWESFHAAWSTTLMADLNNLILPPGYFAETQVHLGGRVEIDIASFDGVTPPSPAGNAAATATLPAWAPPAAAIRFPATFPDAIEVLVYRAEGGATLAAAIELVSPGNKDRPESRRAFASKCASLLQDGVGLVVVDVVTTRQANLHDELADVLRLGETQRFPDSQALYAAAYRPLRNANGGWIDLWPFTLTLDAPLPVVPLALRDGEVVPVDLERAYVAACLMSGLPGENHG